jgi:hypothetical protein
VLAKVRASGIAAIQSVPRQQSEFEGGFTALDTSGNMPTKEAPRMKPMDLSPSELSMLIQSLDHCLATCHHDSKASGVCSDCEAAKALRKRLETQLVS